MNGYLLDTNIALLAVSDEERLSPKVRAAVTRGPAFLSVISYWEVVLRSRKGLINVGDPRQWWSQTLQALDVTPLVFRSNHLDGLHELPAIHQDPFDRAMIAQATVEDLVFLTTDSVIVRYAGGRFRVIV